MLLLTEANARQKHFVVYSNVAGDAGGDMTNFLASSLHGVTVSRGSLCCRDVKFVFFPNSDFICKR